MAPILRKTLAEIAVDRVNKVDEQQRTIQLAYSAKEGWSLQHLSYWEKVAKILPDIFLEAMGCEYIANTKLSHLFEHRDRDIGQISAGDFTLINHLFCQIFYSKNQTFPTAPGIPDGSGIPGRVTKGLQTFFIHPAPPSEEINTIIKQFEESCNNIGEVSFNIDFFLKLEKFFKIRKSFDALRPHVKHGEDFVNYNHVKAAGEVKQKYLKDFLRENKEHLFTFIRTLDKEQATCVRDMVYDNLKISTVDINHVPKITSNEVSKSVKPVNNGGNNCYLIALLQTLANSEAFQAKIKAIETLQLEKNDQGVVIETQEDLEKRSKVLDALKTFMMANSVDCEASQMKQAMIEVKKSLYDFRPKRFEGGINAQQDAEEFLTTLFEALNLNQVKLTKVLHYEIGSKSHRIVENHNHLSIEMYGNSLQSSLDRFFSLEDGDKPLDVETETGIEKAPFKHQFNLSELPDFIPISFKRFNSQGLKIERQMNIDEVIDLGKYTPDKKPALYRVKAVIEHFGTTARSGHYTAKIREGDVWIDANDDRISKVASINVSKGYVYLLEKVPEGTAVTNRVIGKKVIEPSQLQKLEPQPLITDGIVCYLNALFQCLLFLDPQRMQKNELLTKFVNEYAEGFSSPEQLLSEVQAIEDRIHRLGFIEEARKPQNVQDMIPKFFSLLGFDKIQTEKKGYRGFTFMAIPDGLSPIQTLEDQIKSMNPKSLPKVIPVMISKKENDINPTTRVRPNLSVELFCNSDRSSRTYKLKCAIVHEVYKTADNKNIGHYVAYVRLDKQWFRCDNKIEPLSNAQAEEALKSATSFFYSA